MHASGRGRVLGADLEEVLEARREIGVVAVVGSEHLQHSSDQSSRHYSQGLRTERVVLRAHSGKPRNGSFPACIDRP